MVLLADGFTVGGGACGEGDGACHNSESTSAFWAVIPKDQILPVVAHEVFEAAAAPAPTIDRGWDEASDGCAGPIAIPSFGPTFQIANITDNTQGGACTTTGYTSLGEKQDYGVTFERFWYDDYPTFYTQGLRLYILQSYVLANGDVRYNAVWRPGNNQPEAPEIRATLEQLQYDYRTLPSQGWNLYLLQAYVLANGDVRYNAVWRPGTVPEKLLLGETRTQFFTDYGALFSNGWRLYILQTYVTAKGEVLTNAVLRKGDLDEDDAPFVSSAVYEGLDDLLHPLDWRLFAFQSYVVPDGKVEVNAVWRLGTHEEKVVYGWTYEAYRGKYGELYKQGWRLYILNAYVLSNGEVRYDAVWRLGTIDRPL